jgi:hypothetical protein
MTLNACPLISSSHGNSHSLLEWRRLGLGAHRLTEPSKTSSVVSVNSILSDKFEASLGALGAPRTVESQPTHTGSKGIGPNGTRTSTLTSTTLCQGTDAADHDGSFMRHNKYFFKDGNVSFLMRDVRPSK